MERFDSPIQAPNASEYSSRRSARPSFKAVRSAIPIPERLAVSSALVPVLFGILLLWNWRFALALLAGSFAMNVGSSLQSPKWQHRLLWMRRTLPDDYGLSLLLAVAGGSIATLGTYTALSMWMAGGDRWFTVAAIAQGLISFIILCLLGLQIEPNRTQRFDRALQGLSSTDPLSRLLAVQTLDRALSRKQTSPREQQLALDCLALALSTETDPKVRGHMRQTLSHQH